MTRPGGQFDHPPSVGWPMTTTALGGAALGTTHHVGVSEGAGLVLFIVGVTDRELRLATVVLACEVCGHRAGHDVVKRGRRLSLFFVPLIPLGTRYIDVCTACGRTREISRDQAEAVAAGPDPGLR